MSWETISLNDIQETSGKAVAPPNAEYVLRLLSVKPNQFQEGGLSFDMVIAEGPYKNRRVFPTLPAPPTAPETGAIDQGHWSVQAAAKLLKTLGIEQQPGEGVIDVFNRAAQNGHATFIGTTRQYTKGNGDTKLDLSWFSVKPYAATTAAY